MRCWKKETDIWRKWITTEQRILFWRQLQLSRRREEPYVSLANLYLDTGEREKAKEIIAEARKLSRRRSRKRLKSWKRSEKGNWTAKVQSLYGQ